MARKVKRKAAARKPRAVTKQEHRAAMYVVVLTRELYRSQSAKSAETHAAGVRLGKNEKVAVIVLEDTDVKKR
jgi:hypothetical protein